MAAGTEAIGRYQRGRKQFPWTWRERKRRMRVIAVQLLIAVLAAASVRWLRGQFPPGAAELSVGPVARLAAAGLRALSILLFFAGVMVSFIFAAYLVPNGGNQLAAFPVLVFLSFLLASFLPMGLAWLAGRRFVAVHLQELERAGRVSLSAYRWLLIAFAAACLFLQVAIGVRTDTWPALNLHPTWSLRSAQGSHRQGA